MKNGKISIIIPTYNDVKTIEETLDSVFAQTYQKWEIIIVDDGSTDNTPDIIKSYKQRKDKKRQIRYIKQKNADQLNAIKRGLKESNGEYIFILHSDDVLPKNDTLLVFERELERDKSLDSVIGDFVIIDDVGREVAYTKTPQYRLGASSMAKLFSIGGSNFYTDIGLHRSKAYQKYIQNNYLNWNTVFWIDFFQKPPKMLKVKKINVPLLKYRVGATNYNNNKIGKHNVLTGELRTVTSLMKYYSIPFYTLNYRLFSLLARYKVLFGLAKPLFFKRETRNKARVISFLIKKRYEKDYKNNEWLTSLVAFYRNKQQRTILPTVVVSQSDVFLGSDLRKFTNQLFEHGLPPVYYFLFQEMNRGFNKIIVKDQRQKNIFKDIVRFLCIEPEIEIEVKE